jgi:hypothetical protein
LLLIHEKTRQPSGLQRHAHKKSSLRWNPKRCVIQSTRLIDIRVQIRLQKFGDLLHGRQVLCIVIILAEVEGDESFVLVYNKYGRQIICTRTGRRRPIICTFFICALQRCSVTLAISVFSYRPSEAAVRALQSSKNLAPRAVEHHCSASVQLSNCARRRTVYSSM